MDKKAACVTPLLGLVVSTAAFLCFAPDAFATTSIRPGKLASSTEWTKEGSPYVLTGNFEIPSGRVLTIRPGTIVKFGRSQTGTDSLMRVYGKLTIDGEANDPVYLTTIEDDSIGGDTMGDGDTFDASKRYSWAIDYRSASSTRIANAAIANCGGFYIERTPIELRGVSMSGCQSAVYVSAGDISISGSSFSRLANGGISIDTGELRIASSTVSEVMAGHAITAYGGKLLMSSTTIVGIQNGSGVSATRTIIDMTTSEFGSGPKGYGLDLNASQARISSSTISNFGMQGMYVKGGRIDATGLTVTNNKMGGVFLGDHYYLKSELESSSIADGSIFGNGDFGANNTARVAVDARRNWWGSPTGPRNSDKNPTGLGDQVLGNIEFSPWLESNPASTSPASTLPTVMFIPGLEASRLYVDEGGTPRRLWEPGGESMVKELFQNEAGESIRSDVYAKDVIDEVYGTMVLENVYKSLLSELSEWKEGGSIADYSLAPYDWRLTMDEILSYGNEKDGKIYYIGADRATSTPYLRKELARLAEISSGGITIIAHSNGGLVAKALLKKLQDENDPLFQRVDKVILVAVPQYGTPQAIGALLHGYDQGLGPFDLVMGQDVAREFGKNMAGAYPLLPSGAYWGSEGVKITTMPARFESGGFPDIESAVGRYGGDIDSKSELDEFVLGIEGRVNPEFKDIETPSLVNPQLLANANDLHSTLDSWVPPPHMTVHQIAGWGEDTLASIVYRPKAKRCLRPALIGCKEYEYGWTYKPELVIDGDGTVVTPSALAMSTSSENVKRWWVDLGKYNSIELLDLRVWRKHKNIFEIQELLNFTKALVLNSLSEAQTNYVKNSVPPTEDNNRLYFTLHSPLDLNVIDKEGNILSSTTNQIPGGRYARLGEMQVISVPANAQLGIKLIGTGEGMFDLDVEERNSGVFASTSFRSIPASTSTQAELTISGSGLESLTPLIVDTDGNGTEDIVLEPKLGGVSMPPVVRDESAPEVIFSFSTTTGLISVAGKDETTANTIVNQTTSNITVHDEEGNMLVVDRSLEVKNNEINLKISHLSYSTTTEYSVGVNAVARYHFVKNKKGKISSLISHVNNGTENIKAIYNQANNMTKIWAFRKDDDMTVENIEELTSKGAILKDEVEGMLIPYIETYRMQLIIKSS